MTDCYLAVLYDVAVGWCLLMEISAIIYRLRSCHCLKISSVGV